MDIKHVKYVRLNYREVDNGETDKKVNDAVLELLKNNCRAVSIINKEYGLSPLYLQYNIIYVKEDKTPDSTRFLKTHRQNYDTIMESEGEINDLCDRIGEKGGKIVKIEPTTFGLKPALYITNIVYEVDNDKKKIETVFEV